MKRIGIFSGTFDPIHSGHVAFAKEAQKTCRLDRIFFLIEPRPRRKQGVKGFEHRLKMVQLALKDEPALGVIQLEHARFDAERTLPLLQERFKGSQLYMLMGDDMLLTHFIGWPHIEGLISSVHFIIGARGSTQSELAKHVRQIEHTKGLKFNYSVITTIKTEVSSVSVRRQLRKGLDCPDIHPAVARYIARHRLYHA